MPKSQSTPSKTNKLKPIFDTVKVLGRVFVAVEVSKQGRQPIRELGSYPDYYKI